MGDITNTKPSTNLEQAKMLASRLERLSADSVWAHRASGVRGALLHSIEAVASLSADDPAALADESQRLDRAMHWGYTILEAAARELMA